MDAALSNAAKNGQCDQVRNLLDQCADPNAKSIHGVTPLMFAVNNKHFDVAELLDARIWQKSTTVTPR